MVTDGRVTVNGDVCTDLATQIAASDVVAVDGTPVSAAMRTRVWMFHKPPGVVCSFQRQGGDRCLADVLPGELRRGRIFHVGRLDKDSSGLLLLSNDGDLGQRLLHPSHPTWKHYWVRTDRNLEPPDMQAFAGGHLEIDGKPCLPARIEHVEDTAYRVRLREGRRRQIRRMMELLGARVLELRRTAFGPVELKGLAEGAWRELNPAELTRLRRAAGLPSVDASQERH